MIPVQVELTRSHLGYFEFHLCPHNNPNVPEDESCFRHTLQLGDNSGNKFYIKTLDNGWYNTTVRLPAGLTCSQCVFRWHYRAGACDINMVH